MKVQDLRTPKIKGILLGIIVTVIVAVIGTPPAFALVVGIIFGTWRILSSTMRKKQNKKDRLL